MSTMRSKLLDFFKFKKEKNKLLVIPRANIFDIISSLFNKHKNLLSQISIKVLDINQLLLIISDLFANKINNEVIAKLLAYHSIGLSKILPLLIYENIDEIYIDGKTGTVIVDTFDAGRLVTNIILTPIDIERLLILAKLISRTIVSEKNPSLKTTIYTDDFLARISIDFPPLVDYPQIDIRKIKAISLSRFIKNRSDILQLSVLFVLLALRKNIIIIGEPGSGKTTLASLLLKYAPSYWRIISIEDVKELIIDRQNLVRIRVNPLESISRYSKELEILKLLHRSPDYVFIGELQNMNDFRAFFHALSAGIKCLATSHASNLESFQKRLTQHLKITLTQFSLLDAIVIMHRKITNDFITRGIKELLVKKNGKFTSINEEKKSFNILSTDLREYIYVIMDILNNSEFNKLQKILEEINKNYEN